MLRHGDMVIRSNNSAQKAEGIKQWKTERKSIVI